MSLFNYGTLGPFSESYSETVGIKPISHMRRPNGSVCCVRESRNQFDEWVYGLARDGQSSKNVTPRSPLCVPALRRLPRVG